jgi:hypothetical protein
MGWFETILLVIVALTAGFFLLLYVAIFVAALLERRPIKPLTLAEPNDPEWRRLGAVAPALCPSNVSPAEANPWDAPRMLNYADTQIRALERLGFSAPKLYKHATGGIYQTRNLLAVDPSRLFLANIRWGTTGSIRNEATVLYSGLDDGCYVVTSDRPFGARTPRFYDILVYLRADFDQLVGRHEQRFLATGRPVQRLSAENPLAEYETILERRARFLIGHGEEYWVDSEQTAVRSTLKGALKVCARSFGRKDVDQSLTKPAGEATILGVDEP